MRHPAIQQYIKLLVAQKRIINKYLNDNIDFKSRIEQLIEKIDYLILDHQVGFDLKAEAIATLNTVNTDIEISTLEKQALDEKITTLLAA